MFVHDPFDVAPHAKRHTVAAWLMLLAAAVFLGFCAIRLLLAMGGANEAEHAANELAQKLRAETQVQAARRVQSSRDSPEVVRARAELQGLLRLSWTGLFEVLEVAGREVDGRATIVSLAPVRLRPEGAEVGLTAVAVSNAVMVQYLRALESDPRVRNVQLNMQQTATSGAATVVRFQASLVVAATEPASRAPLPVVKTAVRGDAK